MEIDSLTMNKRISRQLGHQFVTNFISQKQPPSPNNRFDSLEKAFVYGIITYALSMDILRFVASYGCLHIINTLTTLSQPKTKRF